MIGIGKPLLNINYNGANIHGHIFFERRKRCMFHVFIYNCLGKKKLSTKLYFNFLKIKMVDGVNDDNSN